MVEDLGAKNGTFTGSERIARGRATVWRPPQMLKVGRTVLALEEPLNDALARIEGAPDEAMAPGERPPSSAGAHDAGESAGAHAKEAGDPPSAGIVVGDQKNESRRERAPWSRMDIVVMAAALSVLLLSMIGLVWLLHG